MNYRKEARGRECQIRIPGTCNRDSSTTVLCHLNGSGLALKKDDRIAAWGCSSCHDAVDGRSKPMFQGRQINRLDILLWFYEGVFRTQEILIAEGKL